MMTQEEMVLRLGQMDRELDRVDAFRRMGSFDEAMQRLTAAVSLQLSVLRPVAVAVLPGEKQEAPKAAEAPQDVMWEPVPAPVAIVTDDQVREFARPRRASQPGVFEMLMNAAFTIESLSRDMCDRGKEIAELKSALAGCPVAGCPTRTD